MNTIYIDEKTLRKFARIKSSVNNESKLYKNKDTLYKILNPTHRTKERQQNIERLSNYSHKNCVFPNDLVYSKEDNSFIGLTMDYLDDYLTLKYAFKKGKASFNDGKAMSYQLCDANKYLEKNGISYFDFHTSNVMVKNDDIKLIDMDGSIFHIGKYSQSYELQRKNIINMNLSQLCFLLLYGSEFSFSGISENEINELRKNANRKQKEFLNRVFLVNNNVIDIADYLDYFDEQFMEDSKLVLHR